LQGQAERLARRLTDAIDQLELELGPGAEFPPLPSSLTAELGVEDQLHLEDRPTLEDLSGDDGPDGAEPALPPEPVALLSGSEGVEDTVDEVDSATLEATIGDTDPMQAAVTAENRPASGPELPEEHVEHVPSLDDALIELPSEPDSSVDVESPDGPIELAQTLPSGSGQFVLLVHGVPRAAMALSLKRHLEMLEMVRTVEPREFAAGVLRLQLQVERDITTDDLNGWTPDSGFRTIHARSGLLEIQLLA
jgi:hypothetical protein